ncbi:MAG: MATE family efflux transporter [Peptostreptococcus sp.]|uniref:MATE family efflux transporter n=1 Tax=Peptostreptococcus sp. TaxID=1262 RepID=UPI002FC6BAF6
MVKNTTTFKQFARYSSLNVFGMLALSCYILADTFFVSKGLGADGLTALNLAIPIYSFIRGCGLMIGMGGATKFSIYRIQGKKERANEAFSNSIFMGVAIATIFFLIGLFLSEYIVGFLGANKDVFDMSKTYLQVILLFAPAFMINEIMLCFVRNDGAPQLVMLAMLTGSLSNIILDYIFIFPFGMGIFGAVLATGIAPIINMIVLSPFFIKGENSFKLVKCKLSFSLLKEIISTGLPSLITEVSSGIVIIVFNTIILGIMGNIGVAAYGVIANLSLVVISMYTGIAQGIQPLISNSYGSKKYSDVKDILKYAMITMLILSLGVYLMITFGAAQIAGVFNSDNNLILQNTAVVGLKIYFLACPFVGFNIIMSVYFTSTESPKPANAISILRGFIIIVPLAFLLSYIAGMTGIWLVFPTTEFIVSILALVFYIFLKKKIKSIE